MDTLPVWEDSERARRTAEALFEEVRRALGPEVQVLDRNRARALQQREIAEEIHRRKRRRQNVPLVEDERALFSRIRAGDRRGARRELNRMLGAIFSLTADIRLIKAHLIETMGYLVRRAVEDSPLMSPLIERNLVWMSAVIDAEDFEQLSQAIAASFDAFLRQVEATGQGRSNETVSRILNILSARFREPLSLKGISREAGVSVSRAAHLVKEVTGSTILQHLLRLRVQEARRLLETGTLSCAEIAYETGFSDQSYFIKQFRRRMGVPPARYRRMLRGAGPAAAG